MSVFITLISLDVKYSYKVIFFRANEIDPKFEFFTGIICECLYLANNLLTIHYKTAYCYIVATVLSNLAINEARLVQSFALL